MTAAGSWARVSADADAEVPITMTKPFKGVINIDTRDSTPDWDPYVQPMAQPGAPNVLYIVLDDVGFSAMEPWGGLIETPNINKLAEGGLTYTNWHTTALCSPTRSSLLTGRNHTTNGMACIAEATTGFPGSNGHVPFECATVAEVLGERGWNTYMLGKWHLCPADELNMASTKRNWPVGRGFERYYGFLGGETNQWYPDLVYDNHYTEQPKGPEDGYHLTEDLTDKAIGFIRDAKVVAPDKPFFMYFCPGATHAPHHAPKEWIEKYKGSSTWAMRPTASRSSSASSSWASCPRAPGCPRSTPMPTRPATTAPSPGPRATPCALGTRCRMGRRRCSAGWPRCTRASSAMPTTTSAGCSTTWKSPASSTTRSWCWCPTTAPPARAAPTARSTRTSSSTASPTTSRRTSSTWMCSAAPRPTTTTRPAGPLPSTRRSSCGSATTSKAGWPTR